MKTTDYLTVSGIANPLVATTQEAITLRDSLLVESKSISLISTVEQATSAAEVLTRAKQLTRYIEIARTDAKAAPLQLCREIDAHAKKLTDNLDAEAKRVGQVLAAFQAEQNRIAEQKRREAFEEEQRIRREAEAKQREADEKARKIQEELERKANVARTEANAERYRQEAEARRIKQEADDLRRADEERQRVIDLRQSAAVAAPVKQAGITTKRVLKFQVFDAFALFESAPYLCKIEPVVSALTAALKQLNAEQKLPGVKHWYELESIVR